MLKVPVSAADWCNLPVQWDAHAYMQVYTDKEAFLHPGDATFMPGMRSSILAV